MPADNQSQGLSRRDVLTGVVAIGAAFALPGLAKAQDPAQDQNVQFNVDPIDRAIPSRTHHTAIILPSGWVIVAGGMIGNRPTSSVLLVNPHTGEFSNIAPLNMARCRHAATVLPDGRVAVLGGYFGRHLRSVEVFNPDSNTWTTLAPMDAARADFAVAPSERGLLLIGGTGSTGPLTHGFYSLRLLSNRP